jgi:hypothetical protein
VLKLVLPRCALKSSSEAVLGNLFHQSSNFNYFNWIWYMIMMVIKRLWILFLFHFCLCLMIYDNVYEYMIFVLFGFYSNNVW